MNTIVDISTGLETSRGLPWWRLSRDYPKPLLTALRADLDTSTGIVERGLSEDPHRSPIELSLEITQSIAKAITANLGLPELCRQYVQLVAAIPEVQLVMLSRGDDTARILTVIDAVPFERMVRDRVYQAQQSALLRMSSPLVEFHLINVSEVEEDMDKLLPRDGTTLYHRKTAQHAQRA